MTNSPNPIRILIVDDHPVVRTGLSGMLNGHDDFHVIGEAENGEDAIRLVDERHPDMILMDLNMPVMNGLRAIEHIHESHPDIRILVLTTYDQDKDIIPAIKTGANGYLLKGAPREVLYSAIHAVANGDSYFDPSVANKLAEHVRKPLDPNQLSEREIEVLEYVAQGKSNKEIGASLHISTSTVKTHLLHIYDKLDVDDRTLAVTTAIKQGIIQLD